MRSLADGELSCRLLRLQLPPSSPLGLSACESPLPHRLSLNGNRMSSFTFSSNRRRPRHFHQGPDETKEQREETAAATQPPVARLYRHALESIFGFLSLQELSKVLSVSRSWVTAVGSMRSLDASCSASRWLLDVCLSRLARHVGTLGSEDDPVELSREFLYIAATRMIGLHTLYYNAPSPFALPPLFPPTLTLLDVSLPNVTATEVNSFISSVSYLRWLRSLALDSSVADFDVSFAPLARLAHLQELQFIADELSPKQIYELRALPHLTSLEYSLMNEELGLMLRPPHQLQWQKLQIFDADEEAPLLTSLSSLTDLTIHRWKKLTVLQHAATCSNLRALMLADFQRSTPALRPKQLIAGVGQCTRLTSLTISNSSLSVAHASALLSCMPAVSELTLCNMDRLESLSFLSSDPLRRSLTSLVLKDCRHAALLTIELRHIFALQQLTHLTIQRCFAEKLCSFVLNELKAPSARLPKLIESVMQV